MKKVILFLSICFSLSAFAAKSYHISVNAPQLVGKPLHLAAYFNGKIYAIDTVVVDAKGKGVFAKNKALDEGMYLFYINSGRYYEFLVGKEQTLTAKIDTTQTGEKGFEIGGAPQTDAFIALGKYMTQKRHEQEILVEKLKGKDSLQAKENMKTLDKEVIEHQKQLSEQYKGGIMGLFINALQQPQFPPEFATGDMQDKEFLMRRYQYAKNHFWDNYDLSDRRSWRLNLLNKRLDDFTEKVLIQIPDSIAPEVVKLVEKSKGDTLAFQLMLNYMINFPLHSKVMGMDKVFVELADRYYLSGQATWADSTTIANVKSEAEKVRRCLIGMAAGNLPMETYDGQQIQLYNVKKPYTLLFFYEPSCGHCREATPKIHEVYKKYKAQGFEVLAFYLMTDRKEWKEFLDKHSLYDWTNVWDPRRESFYWYYFDTSTTPGVYLLDKDKKIIAKKIDHESLDKILDFELNKKEEEK